jgi:hypothetical protein
MLAYVHMGFSSSNAFPVGKRRSAAGGVLGASWWLSHPGRCGWRCGPLWILGGGKRHLIVRFSASGHLEMAWHLYVWGDDAEVLAPPALRQLVENHRRSDFPALP